MHGGIHEPVLCSVLTVSGNVCGTRLYTDKTWLSPILRAVVQALALALGRLNERKPQGPHPVAREKGASSSGPNKMDVHPAVKSVGGEAPPMPTPILVSDFGGAP